ncbi:MAG: hypothetical protein LW855_08610, partial [Alphaproteobacteria bacterium]|nr:hypothetical protein [Alphaproteobacteria bacterium]
PPPPQLPTHPEMDPTKDEEAAWALVEAEERNVPPEEIEWAPIAIPIDEVDIIPDYFIPPDKAKGKE